MMHTSRESPARVSSLVSRERTASKSARGAPPLAAFFTGAFFAGLFAAGLARDTVFFAGVAVFFTVEVFFVVVVFIVARRRVRRSVDRVHDRWVVTGRSIGRARSIEPRMDARAWIAVVTDES